MNNATSPESPKNDMPFLEHLLELRDRLLRIVLAIIIFLLCLMPFTEILFITLAEPLLRFMPEGTQMIAIDPAAPFFTPFKLAIVLAIFITIPYILHQAWSFIAPGLYTHEKAMAMPLLVSSICLFYLGMAFAYYVVFPILFGFMVTITPEGVSMMTDISRYLDFVLKLFFAFGVAFEVPIATILLVWMGLWTPDDLAEKRPYIIIGAFVIGMFMTPPDIFSQTLLAVPVWLLFEVGLLFARALVKRREAAEEMFPTVREDDIQAIEEDLNRLDHNDKK